MKKGKSLLGKLLLTGALLVGTLMPVINVQAEPEVDVESRRGLKPMIQMEMPDNHEETEMIFEKVYVSEKDIAYWTKFSSDYFYNTLTEAEKVWWDDMEMKCIAAATGTEDINWVYGYADEEIGSDRMRELVWYFMYTNKQYYFLANYWTYGSYYGGIGIYEEFTDGEARATATKAFTSKMDAWVEQVNAYDLPEEKEKAAHDIICNNTVYKSNEFDQSAYSMVCLGQTVCAGYAASFQTLLNAAGVDTITVTGSNHGWNVVNIHGNWYQVDVTWNDTDDTYMPIYYNYYNRSRQTFQSGNDGHFEYDEWEGVLPDAKYDMMSGYFYTKPYFTQSGNTYVVVNENTALGDRMVKLIDSNGTILSALSYNDNVYILAETGAKPVISNVKIIDASSSGYTVTCKASDDSGISRVSFPTWSDKGWQDDLEEDWYNTTAVYKPGTDGTYYYRVNTSDHKEDGGNYYTHIYAYDAAGNYTCYEDVAVYIDKQAPVISNVSVKDVTGDGYTVVCTGTDDVGIVKACFPTWTDANGQDDLVKDWKNKTAVVTPNSKGEYEFRVKSADHNKESGKYYTHVYLFDAAGNHVYDDTIAVNIIPLKSVSISTKTAELVVGDTQQLKISYKPSNTSENMTVKWSSSDKSVATVNSKGVVTAKGRGEATITAAVAGKQLNCVVTVKTKEEVLIEAFVERMYTVALGRASDPSGITFWTNQLMAHEADGAGLSEGFILSGEFAEKKYSDAEYLKVLYKTFFNREADENGSAYWISQMNAGRSRRSVLVGFVNSAEFDELCTTYGIVRGTMEDDATATGVGQFVERMYTIALERASEPAGLAEWTRRINAGESTPEDVAKFFFLSDEYVEKNTSNDKYIETLYLTFMGRASEASGKAYWVDQLNQGVSRATALEGFAQSPEFQEIMKRYGL